ncbi:TylF/MycF/NovP-related O-methyltransferase [Cyanobium sp. Morenito 9A2]|uniref:TylF/MycF/NovP-related O-methyltransferase n=1 Tax=Cyanobium sp. Morenito 9A2 TaxID=2823718 RepID=UPI0020CB7DBE|nr:TylF/MycF/NovP-related O-methyltransferase [Cyanobium sp. Morenito 9A2]MCP9850237.1 TylF/MycF family methyltransferase [Cyanobium sp. Morenito 9A2]
MENTDHPLNSVREVYVELLKKALLNTIYKDPVIEQATLPRWKTRLSRLLLGRDVKLFSVRHYDSELRDRGIDWPSSAHTMIGVQRMDNLRHCLCKIIEENIPGDFIETGVWRGGASIFAKGIFDVYGQGERRVWLADSFEGLPKPNPVDYPEDAGDEHYKLDILRVGLDEVRANFASYDLLDDRVLFVKGWFKDTLHTLSIDSISVLRLDGDMYESTIVALDALYGKVSIGGFVIVDDYCISSCAKAVHDFRERHHIQDQIMPIDGTGVYWQKLSDRCADSL